MLSRMIAAQSYLVYVIAALRAEHYERSLLCFDRMNALHCRTRYTGLLGKGCKRNPSMKSMKSTIGA